MAITNQTQSSTYKQFPMRITSELANELDALSKQTRINKTTISRIALQKFITELKKSGAGDTIGQVCAYEY